MQVRGVVPALVLAIGLLTAWSSQAEAVLNADQMRNLAFQQMQAGQYQTALDLTDVLLARDPGDAAALIVRAQALRGLNRLPEAEAAARKAFAVGGSLNLLYGASLAMAQVMAHEDHWTWAQIWLRRASHYATTDEQRARVAQDYRYVRSQNPLNLRFDFSVQPSDNVNNGSLHSVWDFFGIPLQLSGEAQALSGIIATGGIVGSYVLGQTQITHDALLFGASESRVFLSPDAQALAPEANNAAFTRQALTFGYEHKALLSQDGVIATTTLNGWKEWYGSAPLADIGSLSVDLTAPLMPQVQGFGHFSLTRNVRLDNPLSSSTVATFSGGWGQLLKNGDGVRVEGSAIRTISDDIGTDNGALGLSLNWNHAQPVAGTIWGAGLSVQQSHWAQSPYDPTGRQDLELVAQISAELSVVSIYGFSPVLNISYATNTSNIDLYDSRTFGVGVSIRSRF